MRCRPATGHGDGRKVLGIRCPLASLYLDDMSLDASRVVFMPHVGRHLLALVFGGLAIPSVIGGLPLAFLLTGLVWVLCGFSAAWHTALVLAGLLLVAGLVIAVLMVHDQWQEVRWIELQPAGEPTLVVFKKVLGTDSMAVADLRLVNVVETLRLGQSTGSEILFTTAEGHTIRCPKSLGPSLMAPAAALGGWFTDRLGPSGVEVTYETVVKRAHLTIESWYTRSQVAAIWEVPREEVDGIVDLHEVRREAITPRVGAMHGVNRTMWLFDPDDVHTVAAQLPTARGASSYVPPEETEHGDSSS